MSEIPKAALKFESEWKVSDFIADLSITIFTLFGAYLRYVQMIGTDLWYDEVFTGIVVRDSWETMFNLLRADRVHPPLYFSLLKLWTFIFGGESAFNIRSFSMLFGVLLVPFSYVVVQQFNLEKQKKRMLGIATAFIFAFSPFFITYSVEARSYAFLGFLALVSLFFFIRAMRNMYKISRDLVFWFITLLVIFFTHYLSILIILGYIVAYILLVMLDKGWIYSKKIWTNITIFLLTGWISVTYIWHIFDLKKLLDSNNLGWIAVADFSVLPKTVAAFLFGVDRQSPGMPPVNKLSFPLFTSSVGMLVIILIITCATLVISKLGKNKKKEELQDIIIAGSVGIIPVASIILASSLGLHIYVERYIIGYGICIILAAMLIFWHLFDKKILAGLAVYSLLLMFVVLPPVNTKYTEMRDFILTQRDKHIVFEDPGDFIMYKYYLPDVTKKVIVEYPDGDFSSWALIDRPDELEVTEIQNNSLIVVWKYGGFKVPQEWKLVKDMPNHAFYVKE